MLVNELLNDQICIAPQPIPILMQIGFVYTLLPFAAYFLNHYQRHFVMDKNSKLKKISPQLLFSFLFQEKKTRKKTVQMNDPKEEAVKLEEREKRIVKLTYRLSCLQQAKAKYEHELEEQQQTLKKSVMEPQTKGDIFLTSVASKKSTAYPKPDNPNDPNYLDQLEAHISELERIYKIT